MTATATNMILSIPLGKIELQGELTIPSNSSSLVIFSHGTAYSRFNKRNLFIAGELHKRQIATLLVDLLTKDEDELYTNRLNIDLLTVRLIYVTNYVLALPECAGFSLGYFGTNMGTAASIKAASFLPKVISAVVSKEGRPDLAMESTNKVKAATLLIADEQDNEVLRLNRQVYDALKCRKELDILPSSTHLFEDQQTLQKVAGIAVDWFSMFLKTKHSYSNTTF